jgi:hypothetical protein
VSNCFGSIYFLLYFSNLPLDINSVSVLEAKSDVHFNPYKPYCLIYPKYPVTLIL